MNKILSRLKHTAKLEALITSNADYDTILRQSQKIDKYIVEEMKKANERKEPLVNNQISKIKH